MTDAVHKREFKSGHNSVTVQNRIHVYTNFFDHKDLGNHLLQLRPKVVKHPVYSIPSSIRVNWRGRSSGLGDNSD
jgi:hypothetical protein